MKLGSGAALLVVILAVSLSSNGQTEKLTMSGIVTDQQSRMPIQGATVTVVGNKANQEITDAKGSFVLHFAEGAREGQDVRIRIEKPGYRPYDALVPITATIPLQVFLAAIKVSSKEASTPASLCVNQNPVRIISIPGRNYEPATRIHKVLNEHGCDVEGPFLVSDIKENPRTNEVRYFHQKDKDDASRVAEFVKKETNSRCEATYLVGYQDEPKGQLEVWIKQ